MRGSSRFSGATYGPVLRHRGRHGVDHAAAVQALVGYALGSSLENHDEEGVDADPHFGENNTFYLQAMATSPAVRNDSDLENDLLDSLRACAVAAGFDVLSTLIEERLREPTCRSR